MMRFDRTQLPANWDVVKIGDCCDILDSERVPLNRKERREREGDIPYYGANGQVGWVDDWIFDEELVLLAEDGGHFDEYETRPIAYRISGKSWVNNHAHVLRARSMTSNNWVYYNLVHRDLRKHIKGGTRDKLNQGDLRQVKLPLPPKDVQRRIAAVLDTVDAALRETDAVIAKQEQVKTGLLQDLLTRGLDADGRLRDPDRHPEQFREIDPTTFAQELTSRIPVSWKYHPISDCLQDFKSGAAIRSSEYSERGFPVVAKGDVTDTDRISLSSERQYVPLEIAKKYGRSVASTEHVVVTMRDLVPTAPSVGMASVVEGSGEYLLAQGAYGLKFDAGIVLPQYFVSLTRMALFRALMRRMAVGSTQVHVRSSEYKQVHIPIPPLDEQSRIVEMIELLTGQATVQNGYRRKLQRLKTGLMQDLLTGRKRVPEIEEQVAEALA
jgi:type I restriction enzyme S subunit